MWRVVQNDDSETARKQREADQLRAAEKFMVVGTGEAECTSCGFIYDPRKGDPEYPVGPGTQFGVRAVNPFFLLKLIHPKPCASEEKEQGHEHGQKIRVTLHEPEK